MPNMQLLLACAHGKLSTDCVLTSYRIWAFGSPLVHSQKVAMDQRPWLPSQVARTLLIGLEHSLTMVPVRNCSRLRQRPDRQLQTIEVVPVNRMTALKAW